jgi:folylpolyglutamate synthase/dihydropteroate synthase
MLQWLLELSELAGENFPVSEAAVRGGLKTVAWPGALKSCASPTVILDGAHNGEACALAEGLKSFGRENVKAPLCFNGRQGLG